MITPRRRSKAAETPAVVAPRWVIAAFATVIVVLAITGVTRLGPGNYLNATSILELTFIALPLGVIVSARNYRLNPRSVPLLVILVFILAIRGVIVVMEGEAPVDEALRAHKWVIYMVLLVLLIEVRAVDARALAVAVKVLLGLAAAKYTLTVALGYERRPTLLRENNYEIALFTGALLVMYPYLGRRRNWYVALLVLTVALSGSRSGIIALLIGLIYILVITRAFRRPVVAYGALIVIVAIAIFAWSLFDSRSGGGQLIDRQRFLEAFLSDSSSWDVWTWLFGTHPISQISPDSCRTLGFWAGHLGLDGDGGEGSCYSVVFHAFLIRVVYDFGVIGLILAFGGLWFLLRLAKVDSRLVIALLGVAIANSASVSGINNVYVMLPFAFAILTSGMRPTGGHEGLAAEGGRFASGPRQVTARG